MKVKDIKERIEKAYALLENCVVCPRKCGVNRLKGEKGFCGVGKNPKVASYNVHYGEEPPISGTKGSGTIFFSGCSLRCIYCQNFPISQMRHGKEITTPELADMMLFLQSKRCHNINLVTPTHFVPQILEALSFAWEKGFDLPLVYNTSGYDDTESLKLLEGVIDVYLPDMRYSDNQKAKKLSAVGNYVEVNRDAIKLMYSQVENLVTDKWGVAQRGLIIRHLILPDNLTGSEETFRFIKEEISEDVYVSLMGQYFPSFKASRHVSINRKILPEEYGYAVVSFFNSGLRQGWVQEEPKHEARNVEE
ncbi:MAG: radical SAM protein [candidate division Zixibacteria bacterium SM23_73_3]|nr:MAG: radical SAM protein [candidate division Zixibacteria bacterium SM23_73_3]